MIKIGGSALKNGIILFGNDLSVTTTKDKNGTINNNIKTIKIRDLDENNLLYKTPFIRGIFRYLIKNPPFIFVLILTIIPDIVIRLQFNKIEASNHNILKIVIIIMLLIDIKIFYPFFKGRELLQYHGAEHKVINTCEKGIELTIENVRNESRLSERCGSMIIIYLLIFICIFTIVTRFMSVSFLISLSLIYELKEDYCINNSIINSIIKLIDKMGLQLQKLLTKEPNDEQIEVGIICIKKLIEECEKSSIAN